jgi:hypothetical protein
MATLGRGSRDRKAFRWIHAKRLDLLAADRRGRPVLAIEHQGSGHFQGDWKQRDAVKRAVLEAAGIPLLEIPAGAEKRPRELEELVFAALAQLRPAAAHAA